MTRILLTLICILLIHQVFAQENYPKVASDACNCIDKINLKAHADQINQKALQCLQNEYTRQDAALKVDLQKIKKQNPALTEVEASKLLGEKIFQLLMKNCTSFQNITMQGNKSEPETSKAILTIGAKICDCIPIKQVNDATVDKCVNAQMESAENIKIIKKEFNIEDAAVFEQFGLRVSTYLLSKCDKYIQWTTKEMNKNSR